MLHDPDTVPRGGVPEPGGPVPGAGHTEPTPQPHTPHLYSGGISMDAQV